MDQRVWSSCFESEVTLVDSYNICRYILKVGQDIWIIRLLYVLNFRLVIVLPVKNTTQQPGSVFLGSTCNYVYERCTGSSSYT